VQHRVTRIWVVDTPDADAAREAADSTPPSEEVIRPAALPEGRYGRSVSTVQDHYEQPLEVLDQVWDEYMDRSLPPDITNSVRSQLPSLPELATGTVSPQMLSLLFDCAISVYRRNGGH
jgi:hypothetical protein